MRDAPAEMTSQQFRDAGHRLVDQIAEFLSTIDERPVAPASTPHEMRERIGGDASLPDDGADPAAIVSQAAELLFDNSTFNGHPRFFGYITSSASPIGALADMLAATVNANCGAWSLSPIATEIELQTIRWIAELIGYTTECGGLLVSGGNMANMVCLIAAIRAKAGQGTDVRAHGVSSAPRLVVYASAEVHTWLQKGADICGIGTDAVRLIEVDETRAMNVDALRRQIATDRANGWTPAIVVGTAGSVSTGVIDPLPELAELCAAESMWFHVDGAYGAPAAVIDDAPAALGAMELADSVAVDPHKWLYAPLEAGCALVRDPQALHRAFSFHPPYYLFDGDAQDPPTNFHEWGPQNSRGFRALKVWLTMRQVGRRGYAKMIADDIALARELYRAAAANDELEALTQALSITTFRYVPADLRARRYETETVEYLNRLNTALLERLQEEGVVYLSNAVIGPVFALRACVVNFRTTSKDIEMLVEATHGVGRALDVKLRAGAAR
jgi:glutamate/tyrosine decarboxylase-like PLP-dependent enzyme